MNYLVTSDNTVVTNFHTLELDDLSVNIPKCYTLWSPKKCTIVSTNPIIITGVDENNNIITGTEITIEAKESFSILLESSEESTDTYNFVVLYEGNEALTFTVIQNYVDVKDRLVVLLNNYGIQITDDWVRCFYESDIHETNIDQVLKNRKSSEFLLELMNLIGLRGTYKTLFSAVSYFGYKDIVWFEEHWISKADGVTRRYTEITNDFLDRRLTEDGYTKIGDMTMFYGLTMLDPDEPYDEGGLPNYVTRNINFDDLFFKLLLLRKTLNSTFIPWDAYIVDVVGELKAVEGQQKKWWVANDTFIYVDEISRYGFLEIEFGGDFIESDDKKHLLLREHKMLVDTNMYEVKDDDIKLTTPTAHLTSELIKIEKLDVDELVDLKDFDIITKFQRKDVAIVVPQIKLLTDEVPEWVSGFRVQLARITSDGTIPVVTSKLLTFDELITNCRYGITKTGDYEFIIWAYDQWGNSHKYYTIFDVCKEDVITDFRTLLPEYINQERDYVKRFMQFDSTQQTAYDGIPVVDAADKGWDVNQPNENISVIARKYALSFTKSDLFLPIRRYGTSAISSLNLMPIDEYWAPYHLLALNILKPGVKFSLKTFQHHDYQTIEFHNEMQFLHALIEASKVYDSPFSYFEFDIQPVNTSNKERLLEAENDLSLNMLLVYSRLKSFSLDKVIFRIELGDDVLSNDATELGGVMFYTQQVTWFGRKLTIFQKNKNSNLSITSIESIFDVYRSQLYPAFGCDSMIRFNTIYNTNLTSIDRFVLDDRILTLYNHPLTLFRNPTYMDDGGCTGILDYYYKVLHLGEDQITLYPGQLEDKLLIDYHVKLRVGNVWFTSVKEYGRPKYEQDEDGNYISSFVTEPLDFDHLKSMLDKYDRNFTNELGLPEYILDTLDIYYHDSSFVIRARNGYEVELAHMNFGHKMSAPRHGSITKMFIHPSGAQIQYGTGVIFAPNTDVRFENCDVTWEVIDHFSKQVMFTCYGYVLKYLCMNYGVFDVRMTTTDLVTRETRICEKPGAFLVE